MTGVFRSCMMLAVVSAVVGGQGRRTPPTPPTPPAPPAPVSPRAPMAPMAPMPLSAPRAIRVEPGMIRDIDGLRVLDLDRVRERADEMRVQSAEASREAFESARVITREQIDAAREQTRRTMEDSREALEASREAMRVAPMALKSLNNGMYALAPQALTSESRAINFGPRFQSDPADSLWRSASNLLSSGDQRAAAQRFKELQQKFPNSQYASRAMYFQAFSLYRAGTDAELREAVALLEQFMEKYPSVRFTGENDNPADAKTLALRIRGTLAQRGDAAARSEVAKAAAAGQTCDREDMQVKKEALSALWRVDQTNASPRFEQVLARRDECSLELRRYALQILTQRGDDKAVALLLTTAKSDPSTRMRADAVSYVAKYPNDDVLTALESIAKTEENEEIRITAARSLVGYPAPRARTIVRTLTEDNSVSDNVRCSVLQRYNEDRGSADDATWLKASFAKVTSQRVKSCIASAVGNIGGAESNKWLMDLSMSEQEPASLRQSAFRRVSTTMSIPELSRIYDNAGNRPLRMQVVEALNQRKEPEALDKLIDIVKKGSDPTVRSDVLQKLSQRNDPKVKQMLLDLIDR